MANQHHNGGDKKPPLKVQDLKTKKDPQGGVRKAGKDQTEFSGFKGPGFK